jgi:Xaa-Pro aminopeptidase
MTRENLLIVAGCEPDANLLYLLGPQLPHPRVYLQVQQQRHLVVPDVELRHTRRLAPHFRVLSLESYLRRLKKPPHDPSGCAHIIRDILRDHGLNKITVPYTFPLGLARDLRRLKVKLKPKRDPLFPARQFKSADEIKKISAALTMAEVGLAEGLLALRNARIAKNSRLTYHNAPFTSEKLRAIIESAILQAGGQATHTTVATGRQACNPQEPGHGPLRAHHPIVINVCPRSRKTGYYGDITRTVVKGQAPESLHHLFHTVRRAQELALTQIEAGTTATAIHRTVQRFFDKQGFPTRTRNGRPEGLLQPLGHGLGLDLLEPPSLSPQSKDRLQCGNVVTLEPALYYPLLGAVRLEDVIHVTAHRPLNLTKFEKTLEV